MTSHPKPHSGALRNPHADQLHFSLSPQLRSGLPPSETDSHLKDAGITLVPMGRIFRLDISARQTLHATARLFAYPLLNGSRRSLSFFPSHQIVSLLAPATRTSPLGICLSLSNCVRAFPLQQPAQTCLVQVGCVTRVTFNPIAPASSQKSQLHFNLPFPVSPCHPHGKCRGRT